MTCFKQSQMLLTPEIIIDISIYTILLSPSSEPTNLTRASSNPEVSEHPPMSAAGVTSPFVWAARPELLTTVMSVSALAQTSEQIKWPR